ncbi:MAG: hypothetical protein ACRDNE_06900 [Gaiellaceae bacterium]
MHRFRSIWPATPTSSSPSARRIAGSQSSAPRGDACVSHAFFTMAVTLEGVLAWGLDDVEGSEEIGPYRDAYLEPFAGHATRPELEAAHTVALRLGWLCRALNVHRLAVALQSPVREEHMDGVGIRLRLFADGLLSTG